MRIYYTQRIIKPVSLELSYRYMHMSRWTAYKIRNTGTGVCHGGLGGGSP